MRLQRRRVTLALSGLLLVAGTATLGLAGEPKEKVINVRARRFTYSPDKITLKKDVPVVFELTTADILMGFSVPDFGVRADIVPGKVTKLRLTPDKVGTFA